MEEILEKKVQERAVLVGLNADSFTKEQTATDETLEELEALLETAGGETMGVVTQSKDTPDPRTFIGEGKVEEVKEFCRNNGGTMVIFDNDAHHIGTAGVGLHFHRLDLAGNGGVDGYAQTLAIANLLVAQDTVTHLNQRLARRTNVLLQRNHNGFRGDGMEVGNTQ